MTGYAFDCSWARHGWVAVREAGFTCVILYLSNDPSKNATRADIAGVQAAGMQVLLNWESQPGRPKDGYAAGVQDATRANQEADALGYPRDCAIYYSCDTDATPDQVRPYYQGVTSVGIRPVGAYGGADPVVHLMWGGTVHYAWVANAGSWDHGFADVGAHLHQHFRDRNVLATPAGWAKTDYDESVVLNPSFGQWGAQKDFLMALSDADQITLVADVKKIADIVSWILLFIKKDGYDKRTDGQPTHFDEILAAVAAVKVPSVQPQAPAAMVQTIDYAAMAKAVNDEAAKRLAS